MFSSPSTAIALSIRTQASLAGLLFVPRFSGVEHFVVLTCLVNQVFSSLTFRQPRQAFTRNLVNSFSRPILFCTSVLRPGRFSGVEHSVALNLVVNSVFFPDHLAHHDARNHFSSPFTRLRDFRRTSMLGAAHREEKWILSTVHLEFVKMKLK